MSAERHRLAQLLRGEGIEIGALHRPLPVPAQATVTYVDRLPVAALREHYQELADQELARVDIIGSAEDLSALDDRSVDFVIANHLIEHMEDPIGALKEFNRVLRPKGLLYMCVPDQRVTFDRKRSLTPVDHLLTEHREGEERIATNRRDHYRDWVRGVEASGVLEQPGPAGPEAEEHRVQELIDMDYSIHYHCWDATSFLHFFRTACREERIQFEVLDAVDSTPTGGDELIVLAGKQPSLVQRAQAKWPPEAMWSRNKKAIGQHARVWTHGAKEAVKATPVGPALVKARRAVRSRWGV